MKILIIFTFYLISGPVDCSDVIGYSGGSVIIISKIKWMKILIIFTFYLISGPVDCSDVIGYSGGSVIIISKIKWYDHNSKYILLIRKLKPQDAGTYRFGLGNQSNSTVNLKVHNNASCGVPKIMNAYLGQNITITCIYPGEYERNNKYVDSVDDDTFIKNILDTNTKFQNGRFSISDDRSAKVLSVNISDVREADEVFYVFGVWNGAGSVRYYSYFTEMYLHVTGETFVILKLNVDK
ncbi:hypothetical protein PDJAM_G00070960 [Pangasius djambal]|uniref:Uncharacterized protein n=1 Tax=Pangasius djambal TaxID=1691987 RepID=A0ACC5Z0S0_9TELE|nr:hypothetical protein [Pangasius djambal]